ncbi:hypothetical protein RHSIM_Rhsim13G0212700 [Rhododendron simsii]|uniref:Myb-like domain-containing protein n=1 Tax=Rhododendron simsii TaxID=118357 RepID=A0A834FY02_RHOSS|nr:hypothetical protein RHSIM_Rhsim13G0212700 [Rhododendron simsii]
MEPKIEKFFEPVVLTPFQSTPSLDRHFQSIPWSDADSVADCEREAAEAEKGSSDERKSECQMKLSWALVHSKKPEDVLRGIAMLDSGKIDVAVSIPPSLYSVGPTMCTCGFVIFEGNETHHTPWETYWSPLRMKEKVYLLAVGHYRSGDYTRSLQLVGQCLEIAPDCMQALSLKKAIEDKITIDQSQFSSHQPSETIDLQHPIMQKKKKGQVQTRERNPNWTKEEDEALCRAWLRIPENPTDTDYTGARLWDRIREEFIDILGYEADRANTGLMHRWSSIQPRLIKYSGFVRSVEGGTHTSGYNGEGSIGAAKQLYYKSEGRPFKWVGCWLILKDSTKWNSYTQEHECKKHKIARRKRDGSDLDVEQTLDSLNPSTLATLGSNAGSVSLDNGNSPLSRGSHELPRPLGRKVAKKIHRKKNLDHSEALKFFAEEFNNLRK